MEETNWQSRRGQKPEPLRQIDEGLHPMILKLKEIADYLPETLRAKKSELDEIDYVEAQEIIREYWKKLPPPESVLTSGDLIVLHNVRVSMEGSYTLMKSRWDSRWGEMDINFRKRRPQKPRPKRPVPKVHVPTEAEAAAEPPPLLDTPNVEQIFNDMMLVSDPKAITLEEDASIRPALPAELFGVGFDDEAIPDGVRPMPMDVDIVPAVRPEHDVEILPKMPEMVLSEELPVSVPCIEESVPPLPIAEIPVAPEQMPVDPILPEIVFQAPSVPSSVGMATTSSRTQRLPLGQLLDRLEELPAEVSPKRRRKQKTVENICRKRGTQLTRGEVHRAMKSLDFSYPYLIYKVVLGPRRDPDDDSPCAYPSLNIRQWGKYMPEFFREEIADRNAFTSVADGIIQKLKAKIEIRGDKHTPLRHDSLRRVRASSVGIHTPLGVPNMSGERISAPSTGGLQLTPQVPPVEKLQEVVPEVDVSPRDEMAEEQRHLRGRIPAQRSLAPPIEPPTSFSVFQKGIPSRRRDELAPANLAMDVDCPPVAGEEFRMMDVGASVMLTEVHDEQSAPPSSAIPSLMAPLEPEVSPEESAQRAKQDRRFNRHLRRVGHCESTDESTITLSPSYMVLEEELIINLENLWAEDSSRVVTFAELCPPATNSRQQAARTFEILLNLAGSDEVIITQTSPQPQDIRIKLFTSSPLGSSDMSPLRRSRTSSQGSSRMSFTLGPSRMSSPRSSDGILPRVPSPMSLTLARSWSASSMSLTLDSSVAFSAKPSQSPSDSS